MKNSLFLSTVFGIYFSFLILQFFIYWSFLLEFLSDNKVELASAVLH